MCGKQAAAETVAVKPADEDEDIFGDAGKDYQAELPKSRSGPAAPSAQGQYFAEKDDMADLPALPKAGTPYAVWGVTWDVRECPTLIVALACQHVKRCLRILAKPKVMVSALSVKCRRQHGGGHGD